MKITVVFLIVLCLMSAAVFAADEQMTTQSTTSQTTQMQSNMQGMQMMPSSAAITVDDQYAYVVSGNEILKFRKDNMQLETRAQMPAMSSAAAGAGAGPSQTGQMMSSPMAAITSDNQFVYVVRGNEILKFRKDNLQFTSKSALPAMASPAGAGAGPASTECVPSTAAPAAQQPTMEQQQSTAGQQPPVGQGPGMQNNIAMLQSMSGSQFDWTYLNQMMQNQVYSIRLAKLGAQRATTPQVQALAGRMVRSHRNHLEMFRNDLQSQFGVAMQPEINEQQGANLQALNNVAGADFDRQWLQTMTAAHQMDSQASQLAVEKADRSYVRRQAQNIVNTSNAEIAEMQSLMQTLQ